MRIGAFNVPGLNGKADLLQKLVDSTRLDVIGLTVTRAHPTDRFIIPMTHEALTVEPTGNRCRRNAGISLAWKTGIEEETVPKNKSLKTQLVSTKFGDLSISVAYISAAATKEDLGITLNTARRRTQPEALIMGDINARNIQWDTSPNTKGLNWAEKHG